MRGSVAIVLLALLLFTLTSAQGWGDSGMYAGSIVEAARTGEIAPLFEFGHLLWRPLGFVLFRGLSGLPLPFGPEATAYLALVIPNLIAGIVCAVLFYRIALLRSRAEWISFVCAAFFFCSNAFLNWTQTGSSYSPGLACLTASFWILFQSVDSRVIEARTIWISGGLLALSALFWLPYVTVAPGFASLLLIPDYSAKNRYGLRERLQWAVLLTAITVGVLVAGYLTALLTHGFSTAGQVLTWVRESSHGLQPGGLIKFIFALPRTFINMGQDNILFKRYLLHDPYAQVSLVELIGASLVRVALFYAFFGYVLLRAVMDQRSRRFIFILAGAAAPLLFFALVVFESSATERYLPLFPFLIVLVALVLSAARSGPARIVMTSLLVLAAVSNLWSLSWFANHAGEDRIAASLGALPGDLPSGSVVWVPAIVDDRMAFTVRRPFHPLNQPHRFPFRQVVPIGDRLPLWRQDFGHFSLEAWNAGGSVWISNRLMAPRPERSWNWTEGDLPGLRWTQFPELFSAFSYSKQLPGPDGFSLLAVNPGNRSRLEKLAEGWSR